jgi:hypothetical protein
LDDQFKKMTITNTSENASNYNAGSITTLNSDNSTSFVQTTSETSSFTSTTNLSTNPSSVITHDSVTLKLITENEDPKFNSNNINNNNNTINNFITHPHFSNKNGENQIQNSELNINQQLVNSQQLGLNHQIPLGDGEDESDEEESKLNQS